MPDVFVLDPGGLAAPGRGGGVAAAAGLDRGLGVHGQDAVAGPQPPALVKPLVQVQDHGRLRGEVRGARGDPRLVLPGLDRVLGQDPQHRGHRQLTARPGLGDLGQQFRPGPARQRHPGRGGQLAGQRDHRGTGQLADPPRPPAAGQVSQPGQAPELTHGVHADPQVRSDPRIVPAARRRQHDLRAQPVPVSGLRPPDAFAQGSCARRHSARPAQHQATAWQPPGQITAT